jgi:hypothetical protein
METSDTTKPLWPGRSCCPQAAGAGKTVDSGLLLVVGLAVAWYWAVDTGPAAGRDRLLVIRLLVRISLLALLLLLVIIGLGILRLLFRLLALRLWSPFSAFAGNHISRLPEVAFHNFGKTYFELRKFYVPHIIFAAAW